MNVSNSIFGSNTLKYDDVIGVILSEETSRKTSGGSTSRSVLNAQSRGNMMREETMLEIKRKIKGEEVLIERTKRLSVL